MHRGTILTAARNDYEDGGPADAGVRPLLASTHDPAGNKRALATRHLRASRLQKHSTNADRRRAESRNGLFVVDVSTAVDGKRLRRCAPVNLSGFRVLPASQRSPTLARRDIDVDVGLEDVRDVIGSCRRFPTCAVLTCVRPLL